MNIKKTTIIAAVCLTFLLVIWELPITKRLVDGARMSLQSKNHANSYTLTNGLEMQDITNKLVADTHTPMSLRNPLVSGMRKIIVFKYISGGSIVGGYLSYLVKGEHPLLIFLRGGNDYLGILRPNNPFFLFLDIMWLAHYIVAIFMVEQMSLAERMLMILKT